MASKERTLEEVREDALQRVGKRTPFETALRADVEDAFRGMEHLAPDHWAERWSGIGARYEAQAQRLD